jgi:outer membrane biosynthesis protein TonB
VWKAEGFPASEESALRSVSVSSASHASLARAIEGTPITLPAESSVYGLLSVSGARRGMLCPIVVREKISAVLYADQTSPETSFDPDAIALLCFFIGVAVDRLATRKIHPSPALEPIESAGGEPAWSEAAEAPESTEPDLETYPEPEPAPAPETRPEIREAPEEVEMEAQPEAAEPEPAPEPPPAPPARGIDFDTTAHPYRPPPGVAPAGPRILRGPLAAVEEDPHEHARKIARLLVSDIRLYNEAEIEEGKRHRNIYARLRDDIDRARQTYNDRVPESVRAGTNYFHEELIRSLADGSSDALGS